MRMLAFSNRNLKEIVRDPLTVAFSLGFPLVLLLLLIAGDSQEKRSNALLTLALYFIM